jgi:nucleosome binding factor SPN SPT16 subunit
MRLNNFFKSLFSKKEKPLEPTVEVKNEVIEITSKTVSSQNDSVEVKKDVAILKKPSIKKETNKSKVRVIKQLKK